MNIKLLPFFATILLFLLSSCSYIPYNQQYRDFYSHLKEKNRVKNYQTKEPDTPYLVLLVDAPHLDYSSSTRLLQTLTKHPHTRSKRGDVGHAWILLKGTINGKDIVIEGGHSGELETYKPSYCNGIISLCQKKDPNPIRYLYEDLQDGFFQWGNGGHTPTFAVKINLSQKLFEKIYRFIFYEYNYKSYSLLYHQCTHFLMEIASLCEIDLNVYQDVVFDQHIFFKGYNITLWSDRNYQRFAFSTPDILEKKLIEIVKEGKGDYFLHLYRSNTTYLKE